jgi:hypothetical protein
LAKRRGAARPVRAGIDFFQGECGIPVIRLGEIEAIMADPFLNYFALGLLVFVVVVLFYGIIALHDIPAKIAKSRHHPHEDAIHAAGWVSLFTLHVLWPFLWIWAMAYRPDRGWGFSHHDAAAGVDADSGELDELRRRVAELESSVRAWSDSTDATRQGETTGTSLRATGGDRVQSKRRGAMSKRSLIVSALVLTAAVIMAASNPASAIPNPGAIDDTFSSSRHLALVCGGA